MARGARHNLRPLATERVEVFPKRLDVLRRVIVNRKSSFLRLGDDAILDVRDVHHVRDFVTLELEITAHNVGSDGRTEIAEVDIRPHGWAAIVETNFAFSHGAKFFDLAGECVAKLEHED